MLQCPICLKDWNVELVEDHAAECNDFVVPCDIPKVLKVKTLYDKVIKFCNTKAKVHSKQTRGNVLIRFIELGYDENLMNKVIDHIKNNVQTTIHIKVRTILDHMLQDDHIKNCFETSKGTTYYSNYRNTKENAMFINEYKDALPEQKPKYGSLNIFQEQNGFKKCLLYGESCFILKDSTKKRISFVNGNSECTTFHMCTYKYPTALLVHLPDQYIHAIVKHVQNILPNDTTNLNYIEAQIHGMLLLAEDIDEIVVPSVAHKLLSSCDCDRLEKFCIKNNIKLNIT
jgi:hypothetical protein